MRVVQNISRPFAWLFRDEDVLNIFLIGLSLVLAFALPFSLFLFSYAVLGPLHYMTEINWLNDRRYFVKKQRWVWLLVACALFVSIPAVLHLPIFTGEAVEGFAQIISHQMADYTDIVLLGVVFFAIGLVFFEKTWHLLIMLPFVFLVSRYTLQHVFSSFIVVGIFLPTIIHVYLFTFFFMVLGALNSKKREAYLGVAFLLLVPLIISLVSIDPLVYQVVESDQAIETAQNFRFINFIAALFGSAEGGRIVSLSAIGLKIQTFVAFAYTYHYLNWFSKTSTIGWRNIMSKRKAAVIIAIWIACIALFLYNYEIAYLALFFMAILHIVLEFPLNVYSIKEIWRKLA